MVRVAGAAPGPRLDETDRCVRRHILCRGTLQGVGFRPAVHRLAAELDLVGEVCNDADGARIEVEGTATAVEAFCERLALALPPLAQLAGLEIRDVALRHDPSFRVVASRRGPREGALIPPDTLLCQDCRREIDDPGDRRHRYPFTTCTHCGPRFSLVRSLPYDRERTAMDCFPLCPDCRREYLDPGDRRFRAESTCCPDCGPRVWLADREGRESASGEEALARTRHALAAGGIVAVKGLGGFQLACRADRQQPIERLRKAKRRRSKPFAVMVRDLETALRMAWIDAPASTWLSSPSAPILLLPIRDEAALAPNLAPGLSDVGLLLPTTPLHVELFRGAAFDSLIMTSGNALDEPIAQSNEEALERLADFADLFLLHDREIVRRIDDSILRSTAGGTSVLRRSRGFVPRPIALPEATPEAVLALGAHLQTTACLALQQEAFVSQHVGDLDTQSARDFLAEVAGGLERFLECEARTLAVDLHPDYASTWLGERLAEERDGRLVSVQHHLAHAAAVLGEHAAWPAPGERVAAIVLDGSGWGPDGVAWGSEWLTIDGSLGWQRCAHADALPLLGGARAVREPWRVAVAALELSGRGALLRALPMGTQQEPQAIESLRSLVDSADWPLATGAGRVFEAAGAVLGLALRNEWEGESAARFEALASRCREPVEAWPEPQLTRAQLPTAALLAGAAERLLDGEPAERVASGFHASFSRLAAALSRRVLPDDVSVIALAGGCLANRLLRAQLRLEHERLGLRVLLPESLPPGDGGLAYGQALLTGVGLARGNLAEAQPMACGGPAAQQPAA